MQSTWRESHCMSAIWKALTGAAERAAILVLLGKIIYRNTGIVASAASGAERHAVRLKPQSRQ